MPATRSGPQRPRASRLSQMVSVLQGAAAACLLGGALRRRPRRGPAPGPCELHLEDVDAGVGGPLSLDLAVGGQRPDRAAAPAPGASTSALRGAERSGRARRAAGRGGAARPRWNVRQPPSSRSAPSTASRASASSERPEPAGAQTAAQLEGGGDAEPLGERGERSSRAPAPPAPASARPLAASGQRGEEQRRHRVRERGVAEELEPLVRRRRCSWAAERWRSASSSSAPVAEAVAERLLEARRGRRSRSLTVSRPRAARRAPPGARDVLRRPGSGGSTLDAPCRRPASPAGALRARASSSSSSRCCSSWRVRDLLPRLSTSASARSAIRSLLTVGRAVRGARRATLRARSAGAGRTGRRGPQSNVPPDAGRPRRASSRARAPPGSCSSRVELDLLLDELVVDAAQLRPRSGRGAAASLAPASPGRPRGSAPRTPCGSSSCSSWTSLSAR